MYSFEGVGSQGSLPHRTHRYEPHVYLTGTGRSFLRKVSYITFLRWLLAPYDMVRGQRDRKSRRAAIAQQTRLADGLIIIFV